MPFFTPQEIVQQLDRYIVGQNAAKRSVAIALRNRYRRMQLDEAAQEEITPQNILMVGPTGVGKTEIARRLSKLVDAPFVKVEATKFTEVGYVGRDVESMVRDLVEAAIRLVREQKRRDVMQQAAMLAENRLIEILCPVKRSKPQQNSANPFDLILRLQGAEPAQNEPKLPESEQQALASQREQVAAQLAKGLLENEMVEVEVEESANIGMEIPGMGPEINLGDIMGPLMPKRTKKRKVPVSEARAILEQQEADKLIDMDSVVEEGLRLAEQNGIIFIDEIDKIAGRGGGSGPDVSREGVQRDILPIIEGSTVVTKYGPVKTDYILFIAAGAFHMNKISDLIPELQGRLPIVVHLDSLSVQDYKSILSQPENAITKQYAQLLSVDGVNLRFTEEALQALAEYAYDMNEDEENIGARRLYRMMETLLDDISFHACGQTPAVDVEITPEFVRNNLKTDERKNNLQKYIL